jgi:hypothetical protein
MLALGGGVLVLLTVVLGAVYAALVRAEAAWRVWLGAVLFALTGWAALQYFLLPAVQPLVTEKGFTPEWYALSFAVYGAVLGALLALRGRDREVAATAPATAPAAAPSRPAETPGDQSDIDAWRERMRRLREEG